MQANYASDNRKRDNMKIKRIALDLHDVIIESKKVVSSPGQFSLNVNNSFLYIVNGLNPGVSVT